MGVIVGALKYLPLWALQVLFALLLALTSQGQHFLVLDAVLTAYLVAVALPIAKKDSQPKKALFDIANILAIRLVFSHPMFGMVRSAQPVLVSLALVAQKLMDWNLVQKIQVPSVSGAIGNLAHSYYSTLIPTVKTFRTLRSKMRDSLMLPSIPQENKMNIPNTKHFPTLLR